MRYSLRVEQQYYLCRINEPLVNPNISVTKKPMPNEYSVEIHNYLTAEIESAENSIKTADIRTDYYRGKLKELYWLRECLKEKTDLKDFKYY